MTIPDVHIYVEYEVSRANGSFTLRIKKKKQMWLPNQEYRSQWLNICQASIWDYMYIYVYDIKSPWSTISPAELSTDDCIGSSAYLPDEPKTKKYTD